MIKEKLFKKIEHGKMMLKIVAKMYGYTSPEALRYSQALDKLINQYLRNSLN